MIPLAILHATLPEYMRQARPEESKHFQVLLASDDLVQFRLELAGRTPRVLVIDLALLGDDPIATVEHLELRDAVLARFRTPRRSAGRGFTRCRRL